MCHACKRSLRALMIIPSEGPLYPTDHGANAGRKVEYRLIQGLSLKPVVPAAPIRRSQLGLQAPSPPCLLDHDDGTPQLPFWISLTLT